MLYNIILDNNISYFPLPLILDVLFPLLFENCLLFKNFELFIFMSYVLKNKTRR